MKYLSPSGFTKVLSKEKERAILYTQPNIQSWIEPARLESTFYNYFQLLFFFLLIRFMIIDTILYFSPH